MELSPKIPYGARILEEAGNEKINWGDIKAKKLLFKSILSELLRRQEKVYVISDDKNQSILEEIQALLIDRNSEEFYSKLYDFTKSKLDDLGDHEKLKKNYFYWSHKCNYGKAFREPFFDSKKMDSIIEWFLQSRAKISEDELLSVLKASDYDFTSKEYKDIIFALNEAVQLYEPSFQFLDAHNLFNDSVFINKEGEFSTSILLKYLSNFHSKAFVLTKSYSQFFSKVSMDQNREQQIISSYLLTQINSFIYDFNEMETDLLSNATFKEWTVICNELIKEINQKFDLELSNVLIFNKKDAIIQNLFELVKIVEKEKLRIEKRVREYIRAINIKSNDSPFIAKIEKEIDQLVKSINDSNIFSAKIENNSISSYKQFQNLKEISATIVMAQNQLMHMGKYYNWKAFMVQLMPSVKNIIESIKTLKTDFWIFAFESWYSYKIIEKHLCQEAPTNLVDDSNYSLVYLEEQLNQFRRKALFQLREKKGKLFNKILKKGSTYILDKLDPIEGNLINALAGFHLMDDKIDVEEQAYIIDLVGLQNPSKYKKLIQFSEFAVNIYHENLDPFSHYVKDRLSTIQLNEKLDTVKYLANYLSRKRNNLELYLSKNTNLILNLSTWKRQLFVQEVGLDNFKKVRISDPIKNSITEYLLNDSEKMYYIFDDYYENNQNSSEFYAEDQYLRSLRAAGYELIFLDSARLLKDEDHIINQLSVLDI